MTNTALILVGGYGTRLRPFTFSKPKPAVPFANKPMLAHQIEALHKAGVTKVVLAVSYKSDDMRAAIEPIATALGVELVFSLEETPLGTAGPLALAREHLQSSDNIFMLNSDVTCSFPFEEMLAFHTAHKAEGTILVTKVTDPSKYGVVVANEQGKVERFVEKPQTWVGDRINAGIYILSPKILSRISPKPTSIERETFPAMANDGQLYMFDLQGFWMDVGQPKDYITGSQLYLKHIKQDKLVEPSAKIDGDAVIGHNVIIGANCVVKKGAKLSNCTLMDGVVVEESAFVKDSIIGWKSRIGKFARVTDLCIIGEDVDIKDEIVVVGVTVCPHKSVGESIYEKGRVVL
eukprot:ANDGO_04371.mRNA.1 Mannose-1-phosphate guanyltransferase beta